MLKKLIYFALLGSMAGQVNVTLLPPAKTCLEAAGSILSGGSVSTFAAGTTTPLASYTDSTGTVPNANPVVLDSSGCANIWLGPSSYKVVVKKSDGTTVYTTDGINGAFLNFLSLNGGNALTAIADPAAALGKFWLSLTTTGRLKWSDSTTIHTVIGNDTTDTLTNKTLTSPTSTGTDTGTETLSNKTLISPSLTTPQIGGGAVITKISTATAAIVPVSVAANTCAEQTFNPAGFSGLTTADIITVNSNAALTANAFPVNYRVSAAGTVAITYCNPTGGGVVPTPSTVVIVALR